MKDRNSSKEVQLGARFTVAMVITLSGTLTAVGLALAFLFFQQIVESRKESALTQANVAAATVTAAVMFANSDAIAESLRAFDTGSSHDSAAVYSLDDALLHQFVALGEKPFPINKKALIPNANWWQGMTQVERPLYPPTMNDILDAPIGTLVVRLNQQQINSVLLRGLSTLVGILVVSLFIGSIVAQRFSVALLHSLTSLTTWARRVSSSDDYTVPAPRGAEAEVSRLTESFEMLIAKVAERNRELSRKQYELETTNAHLETLAYTDPLTGLPNRSSFRTALDGALVRAAASSNPVGLYFIDLDQFKAINDSVGHTEGDSALRAAAARLRRVLRTEDFLARLAGDEFVVIIEGDQSTNDALRLGERLAVLLTIATPTDEWTKPLRASVGVALFPYHATDADDLIAAADDAMYLAKNRAGSQYSNVAMAGRAGHGGRDGRIGEKNTQR